jgi:hypothetical protein
MVGRSSERSPHLFMKIIFSFAAIAMAVASGSAPAFSIAPVDLFAFSLSVGPRVSAVGTPRTIFANGCTGPVTIDTSTIATGTLILRSAPEAIGCVQRPPVALTYTPQNIGTLRIIMKLPDGSTVAEAQMATIAGARSTVNLDGMWFDPATNGSGISFHHSVASDWVFGTWFMYANFGSRWFSLQGMQWIEGGSSLTGIAYEATAPIQNSCAAGGECPRLAMEVTPIGAVAISVIDKDNLRIEAFDRYGRPSFVSLLKRLAF